VVFTQISTLKEKEEGNYKEETGKEGEGGRREKKRGEGGRAERERERENIILFLWLYSEDHIFQPSLCQRIKLRLASQFNALITFYQLIHKSNVYQVPTKCKGF
jgi:hypothetical protein